MMPTSIGQCASDPEELALSNVADAFAIGE
jgi:hypothetical protein